jgi:hypothetical protein
MNERNELLTQVHTLKHEIDDIRTALKVDYEEKLTQEVEKVTKFINS